MWFLVSTVRFFVSFFSFIVFGPKKQKKKKDQRAGGQQKRIFKYTYLNSLYYQILLYFESFRLDVYRD